jgi:hypothetical protein
LLIPTSGTSATRATRVTGGRKDRTRGRSSSRIIHLVIILLVTPRLVSTRGCSSLCRELRLDPGTALDHQRSVGDPSCDLCTGMQMRRIAGNLSVKPPAQGDGLRNEGTIDHAAIGHHDALGSDRATKIPFRSTVPKNCRSPVTLEPLASCNRPPSSVP